MRQKSGRSRPQRRKAGGPPGRRARSRIARSTKAYSPVRRFISRVFVALLLASFAASVSLFSWSFFGSSSADDSAEKIEPLHFSVLDDSPSVIASRLAKIGLIESPLLMELYLRFLTPGVQIVRRAHLLRAGLSPRSLVQRLAEVGSRDTVSITFPEGWNFLQIAERLEEQEICSRIGFEAAVHERALLDELVITRESAEGFLFPATYRLQVDTDPRDVVRRLAREARRRLETLIRAQAPTGDLEKLSFNEAAIFTLASIVEKETGRAEEAPRVARVFLNRLLDPQSETRGRLQSDPTAAYGCVVDALGAPSCVDFRGRVTPKMLADSSNTYNTYRHAGLPPGPIANPGERALEAVLRPTDGNWLYFVADGHGGHVFSETYPEHLRAIERLRAQGTN